MRFLLSWFLYLVGCVLAMVMCSLDFFSDKLYLPYNKVMTKASKLQGKGSGPWVILEEDEDGTG